VLNPRIWIPPKLYLFDADEMCISTAIALALLGLYAVKFPIGRAFVRRAFPLGARHLEK